MINFHDDKNRMSYTTRRADSTWASYVSNCIDIAGKRVLDIGGGGGIYSKTLVDLGAESVTLADSSEEMLKGAKINCEGYPTINFAHTNAVQPNLPSDSYDIILQRALIHHLLEETELQKCFKGAFRLLRNGGVLIIQDRIPEDCLLPGSDEHIRGYFFEKFPHLTRTEKRRRHTSEVVVQTLHRVGFETIQEEKLWEVRRRYQNVNEIVNDIRKRTGRSILHELSDEELEELTTYIQTKVSGEGTEKDRWTIWLARK